MESKQKRQVRLEDINTKAPNVGEELPNTLKSGFP